MKTNLQFFAESRINMVSLLDIGKLMGGKTEKIVEMRNISTLKIPNVKVDDSDLMLAFARKLNDMTDSEKADWRKKFDV